MYLQNAYEVSERRACRVLDLHRSTYRYRSRHAALDDAHQQVVKLSERYDYWGYRKIHDLLKGDVAIGRERVRCPLSGRRGSRLGPAPDGCRSFRKPGVRRTRGSASSCP